MLTELFDTSRIRQTAAEWHGGQSSPLYALASSGAIVPGIVREVAENIAAAGTDRKQVARLRHLLLYVETEGERGPVDGWADIAF